MKKIFCLAILLLFSQNTMASILCFELSQPGNDGFSARTLFVEDVVSETSFSGYVKANDDSFGSGVYLTIIGTKIIFGRGVTKGSNHYEFDLSSFDGSHISGDVYFTKYKTNQYKYASSVKSQAQLTLINCPE